MLKLLILVTSVISFSVTAQHLERVCSSVQQENTSQPQNSITNPPLFAGDYLVRRVGDSNEWSYVLETFSGKVLTNFHFPVYSLIKIQDSLWALGAFNLVELDLEGTILETYPFEGGNIRWRGRDMTLSGDTLIISRGSAGLLGFDLTKKKFKWENPLSGGQDGLPSGLASHGRVVYGAVATSMPNGFTGIIVIEPNTGNILRRIPYNVSRWGVIGTDVRARMFKDNLVLNNGGWIHLISSRQLQSTRAIRPTWVSRVIPPTQDVARHFMMLEGDFYFEGDHLVGCGSYTTFSQGRFSRASDLFKVKMPQRQ